MPLIPLEALTDTFSHLNGTQATFAYLESLVVVDTLMQRVGPRMAILLQGLERGQSLEQGLQLTGTSLAEIQKDLEQRTR
jgi:hypothetical protein